jgi:hypothetical protein
MSGQLEARIGADGRRRLQSPKLGEHARLITRAELKKRCTEAPHEAGSLTRDKAIVEFARLLRSRLRSTLDDLAKLLAEEQVKIAELPLQHRVAIARGYLKALGVALSDLGSL